LAALEMVRSSSCPDAAAHADEVKAVQCFQAYPEVCLPLAVIGQMLVFPLRIICLMLQL
jgi:hypothetical protein